MNSPIRLKTPFAHLPSALTVSLATLLVASGLGAAFTLGIYALAVNKGAPLTINNYPVDTIWKALFAGGIATSYAAISILVVPMSIYSWALITQQLRLRVSAGEKRRDFYVSFCVAVIATMGLSALLGALHTLLLPEVMRNAAGNSIEFVFTGSVSFDSTAFIIDTTVTRGWGGVGITTLYIALYMFTTACFAALYLRFQRPFVPIVLFLLLFVAALGLGAVFEQGVSGYLAVCAMILIMAGATWWVVRRVPLTARSL